MADDVRSFSFYRNWYDQAKAMKARDRALFLDAIMKVAFEDGAGIGSTLAEQTAVNMCSCVIAKGIARSRAGRIGGSVSGESKARACNENASKTQAKRKQNASTPFYKNIKGKDKEEYPPLSPEGEEGGEVDSLLPDDGEPPSFDAVRAWASPARYSPCPPDDWLRGWYQEMQECGWRGITGRKLTQTSQMWRLVLSKCWKKARETSQSLRKKEEEVSQKNFAPRVYDVAEDESIPEWARAEAAQ